MIKLKDILNEAMSDAEIKKMHQKYKDTGELPPHLKKMLKGKKDFEKKFKVKNIVVPGLEWMADIDEAKTASIDGEELMNFLMKRFKMSKKKAIDTMKKHKMDTSFIKEAMGNTVVIDRKYIPKIAHVRKVLKLKMGKDLSVYKTDSNNVYHKVSDSQIKRFLDRLDRFDVKYKLGESVNEAHHWSIEPSGIMAKINKIVQDKQAAKIGGVLVDMFSASIMMQIYDKVNDNSKEKMNKGNIRQVQVILHKVMKQNKVKP